MNELKVYVPQDGPNGLDPEDGGEPVEEETCYLKSEVDAVLDEKDKIIAELKEQYKDMDVTHTVHIAKMNARIEELEDNVDLWKKENRKLKRALYKACANWARSERYTEATWHGDEHRELLWASVQAKCLSKTEEYK